MLLLKIFYLLFLNSDWSENLITTQCHWTSWCTYVWGSQQCWLWPSLIWPVLHCPWNGKKYPLNFFTSSIYKKVSFRLLSHKIGFNYLIALNVFIKRRNSILQIIENVNYQLFLTQLVVFKIKYCSVSFQWWWRELCSFNKLCGLHSNGWNSGSHVSQWLWMFLLYTSRKVCII